MASSGNFSTFNPLDNATSAGYGNATFANGNTETTGASTGHCGIASTIATGNTGKYYAEFYLVATSGNAWLGYYSSQQTVTMITASNKWVPNSGVTWNPANLASYFQDGSLYKDGSTTSSWGASFTTGDIIQIAIDADNDAVYYGKNNTWQNSGDPTSGASKTGAARTSIPKNIFPAVGHANGGSSTVTWKANFGQDSTFAGTVSAGGNADANGFGDFKYAPPSGYVALCTANLPISDDIDPAQTDDDIPSKQFGVVTYTGNGTARSFTGLGFQPDMLWIKMRNSGDHGKITDSVRGVQKALISNTTGAETTDTNGVTAFGTDGFSIGSGNQYNLNEYNFVAWCWRGNGGTTASNSNGSITSTVQANTAAGFSIATYTSPGSGTNHTVGHGLSDVDFIITKDRDSTFNWYCFHKSVPDKTYRLNSGSEHSYSNWSMGSTTWGSEDGYTHNSTDKFVAYCWQNVEGMQKFGSYIGNGNSDGPFVYLGFRPRLLVLKRTTSSGYWNVFDSARSTSNPVNKYLSWNSTDAEADGADVDFLSNGFKVRSTASGVNTNGTTYLYMAWADVRFKYNNTF